jgi:hypothetical protein
MPIVVRPSKLCAPILTLTPTTTTTTSSGEHQRAGLLSVVSICYEYGTNPALPSTNDMGSVNVDKHMPIQYNRPLWPPGGPSCGVALYILCLTCTEGFAEEYFCLDGADKWLAHRRLEGNHWWAVTFADDIKWIGAPKEWMDTHPELYY